MYLDYKHYAIKFAKELQRMERENVDIDLNTIKSIREFKTKLGISVPESLEEGTGNIIQIKEE